MSSINEPASAAPPAVFLRRASDALTGLEKRAEFATQLQNAVDACEAFHALNAATTVCVMTGSLLAAGAGAQAVLLLDLDEFRDINGIVGNSGGDRMLAGIAHRLRAITPSDYTLARLDGDEFGWILPSGTDAAFAVDFATRALAAIAEPFGPIDASRLAIAEARAEIETHRASTVSQSYVRVTASGGIAEIVVGASCDDVWRHASVALRRAKEKGAGTIERFTDAMGSATLDRQLLARDLRTTVERAVQDGRVREQSVLYLAFQPIVSLAKQIPTGVEALLRWRDPVRGFVPPSTFVPLAEDVGLASTLGRWVLREACRQIAEVNATLGCALSVSVNVSGRQFDEEGFPDDVSESLFETGLAPELLVLEVTETALVREAQRARRILAELRSLGVGVAIDDFGTGYSSLSYLQQLPLDVLKIDRSFVSEVTELAGPSLTFAQTIVALGRALGLRTVGEGVETTEQRNALHGVGCTNAQGYLFAPPLTPPQLMTWLTEQRARMSPPDADLAIYADHI